MYDYSDCGTEIKAALPSNSYEFNKPSTITTTVYKDGVAVEYPFRVEYGCLSGYRTPSLSLVDPDRFVYCNPENGNFEPKANAPAAECLKGWQLSYNKASKSCSIKKIPILFYSL